MGVGVGEGYHLQVQRGLSEEGQRVGMREVVRRVVERDGLGGLWKGVLWSVRKMGILGAAVCAVSLATGDWEDDDDGP